MSGRYFVVLLLYSLNARRGFGSHLHTITDLHIILPDYSSVKVFLPNYRKFMCVFAYLPARMLNVYDVFHFDAHLSPCSTRKIFDLSRC